MKTHNLVQGSPEWHAHRSTHFNASDAPAMMGCSTYKTRTELLHELKTGIVPTVDSATQFRFDEGHRIEALARPLAEEIIGETLYPVVGSDGELSASFDGLTMDETIVFEHKTLNAELRECMVNPDNSCTLPLQYRVQMEQQLLVAKAEKCLFIASQWNGDTLVEKRHCWYSSDKELRAEIIAGWKQFAKDLSTFVPQEVLPVAVATPVTALPAVSVVVNGALAVTSNFGLFEAKMREYIAGLPKKPSTDQEFADAESAINILGEAEAALKAAVNSAVGQTATLDQVCRTGDMLRELARTTRLALEKMVTERKAAIRLEITQKASQLFAEHMAGLNQRLGRPYMPQVPTDFPGAIKGKRTVESLQNAVDTELARAKIASSAIADKIDANLKTLRELASDHVFLFNDTSTIVLKANDDLTALVKLRISEHKAAEEKKEAESRERIRKEEQEKAEKAVRVAQEAEDAIIAGIWEQARRIEGNQTAYIQKAIGYFESGPADFANDPRPRVAEAVAAARKELAGKLADAKALDDAAAVNAATPVEPVIQATAPTAAPVSAKPAPFVRRSVPAQPVKQDSVPTLALGTISDRLGFNVTSAFLATLGFEATTVKAAKLFHDSDFPLICRALIEHIETVCETA